MGGVGSAGRRWLAVALGLVVFVVAVVVVRSWPAADSDVDAATLAQRAQDSVDRPWSGYVVSQGTLALPDADRFSSVGDLLGERTRLRAWWRGPEAWRVDELRTAGEVGLRHDGALTTEWSYETGIAEGTAERYRDPEVRLPRTVDLLPPELARHVLAGVRDDEVSRIGARRVAGRDALGLRVVPSLSQASVRRVDVWVDDETAVPLSVEVYGDGDDPVLSTSFAEFDDTEPAASTVAFDPPDGVVVEQEDVLDIVDAVSRFAEVVPPRRLAGLPRTEDSAGAVGIYGRGVTRVMALPLDERGAGPLREQLALTPGASVTPERTVVALGPLGVLVTDDGDGDGWLVTGLVTPETLVRAGRSLTPSWAFTTTAAPMTTTGGTP
jgi:hypothetical protein